MCKFQYFEGIKFTRDDSTGYYLNSTIRKRMHRYVYEFYNGDIPKGYHVHHIDGDKSNNDINNLQILTASEHTSMHAKEMVNNNYDRLIKNLNENARPKASEWHKSKEGREWHKKQAKDAFAEYFSKKINKKCINCSKDFETLDNNVSKYCSNSCKTKHRYSSGVDNVIRNCEKCNKEFSVNKYSKSVNCSRSCAMKKKL